MSIQNVKESFYKHLKALIAVQSVTMPVLSETWQSPAYPYCTVFFGNIHKRRRPRKAISTQISIVFGDSKSVSATNLLDNLLAALKIDDETLNETRSCEYFEYDTGVEVSTDKELNWIQVGDIMPIIEENNEIKGYTLLLDVTYTK